VGTSAHASAIGGKRVPHDKADILCVALSRCRSLFQAINGLQGGRVSHQKNFCLWTENILDNGSGIRTVSGRAGRSAARAGHAAYTACIAGSAAVVTHSATVVTHSATGCSSLLVPCSAVCTRSLTDDHRVTQHDNLGALDPRCAALRFEVGGDPVVTGWCLRASLAVVAEERVSHVAEKPVPACAVSASTIVAEVSAACISLPCSTVVSARSLVVSARTVIAGSTASSHKDRCAHQR